MSIEDHSQALILNELFYSDLFTKLKYQFWQHSLLPFFAQLMKLVFMMYLEIHWK